MSKFLKSALKNMNAYVPGEQPQDMKYIKLNTNELPYTISRRVIRKVGINQIENLRLYSDPDSKELVKSIACYYKLDEENIIVGNGSDEIIAFCFMAFCDKNNGICFPDITYGFYEVTANLLGIKFSKKMLDDEFNVNTVDYYNSDKNIILANPNAQTGKFLPLADVEEIIKSNPNKIVIIDEAYVDFGGESCYKLINSYDNLIVIQTLSKSRALAGGRIGFALASKELIADLKIIKYSFNPYNVNRVSNIVGANAICDKRQFECNRAKIIATREWATKQLLAEGFEVLESKANFVLARNTNISGSELYSRLKGKGILVRHFDELRITDYIRITIGTDEQMKILIDTIKLILKEYKYA
jgi:histidinol-phosphate aminotransferase